MGRGPGPLSVQHIQLSLALLLLAVGLLFAPPIIANVPGMEPVGPSLTGPLTAVGAARNEEPTPSPTADPAIEPGFPVQVFGTTGMHAAGPGLHVLVGNVDSDPTLEIAVTALSSGPLYMWNANGSPQQGWPFNYATGAAYPALGEMDPGMPGLEVMANYFGGTWQAINAYDGFANLLPGWPLNSNGYIGTPPTFADIDGDGIDEVWVPQQALYAYRANGTPLPGWPRGFPENTPAIADLDGDQDLEIVATGLDSAEGATSALYAYHHDGALLPNFPVSLGFYPRPYPVIGDVDGDGQREIVVQAYRGGLAGSYIVVSAAGQIERTLHTTNQFSEATAPALADLDGDSYPEIIADVGGMLYAWYGDGRIFPGWPQIWNRVSNRAPVVGDLDGDGWPDIVVTNVRSGVVGEGEVRAYDRFGNLLPGFPREMPISGETTSAIADIDLDGRNELLVSAGWVGGYWHDAVWAFDLHGAGPYGRVEWGQFMGGPKHQGVYVPPACALGEFIDVPPGHTFYQNVACLATRAILSGYPNCTFRPNNGLTRGQLTKIVANAAGFVEPVTGQLFSDVPTGSTFYEYVQRLAGRGHISGYPCGGPAEPCDSQNRPYFRPGNSASRGQISKIVANARGLGGPPGSQIFTDVEPGSTFYDYVQRLAVLGSMSGYPCGGAGEPCDPQSRPYFRPGNNATRGQTAKIVANTFFPNCEPLPVATATPTITPPLATLTSTPTYTSTPVIP